jgi:hypothetical protein
MEISKQSWSDVVSMPIPTLRKYLKWKTELIEEQRKQIEEEESKLKVGRKRFK